MNKNGKLEIPGDYQFRAMNSGPRLQRFWHRNKLWVLDQIAPIAKNHVVVDVGCGSGNLTLHSAEKCKLAIGLDPSESAVQFCNSINSNARSIFIPAAGDALPFPDESVDVVLFVEVIEHLEEPMKIIAELCDHAQLCLPQPLGSCRVAGRPKPHGCQNGRRGTACPKIQPALPGGHVSKGWF